MSRVNASERDWISPLLDPMTYVFWVLFVVSYLVLIIIKLPIAIFQHAKGLPPNPDWPVAYAAGIIAAVLTILLIAAVFVMALVTEPGARIITVLVIVAGAAWYLLVFCKRFPKQQ